MDLEILAAMATRENYERYSRFVKPSSLSEESANILAALGEWYKSNPSVSSVSWKGFNAWFALVRHSKMDKEKLSLHKNILAKLENGEVDQADIAPLLAGLTRRDYASQIADVALRIADGDAKADFPAVEKLLENFAKDSGKHDSFEKDLGEFSLGRLQAVSEPGLQWRLRCLQQGAGDLRQGDLVMFGKRPDSGGTTFMASEATCMAEQLDFDKKVLWLNNEEEGDKVRRRILQAALGWSGEDMDAYLPEALEEYTALMGGDKDKIMVYDKSRIHVRDVEALLKRFNVGLIIADQLWKFKGFEEESAVERQTSLANWAREISKDHAPFMAVHQLGGDAENVLYPTQDMLYGSKTGIQGEADLIIMLGRKVNQGHTRGIWLPKNKMLTPANKALRNGRWQISLDADHARYEE